MQDASPDLTLDGNPFPGSGVFAAFLDLQYDPMVLQVDGPIVASDTYGFGTSGSTSTPGLIDAVGGVDGLTPLGRDRIDVFSIDLLALSSGRTVFQLSAPEDQAEHQTLRFGINQPVPVECIDFGTGQTDFPSSCLSTVPEPTSMGLLFAALVGMSPLLRRKSRR